MSADYAHASQQHVIEKPDTRSLRARIVLAIGPATVLAGIAWAVFQPYRLTILHPHGQGLWWLLSEPPVYVVLVGVVFRLVVAPSLARDVARLDGHEPSLASREPPSTPPASLSRGRPTQPVDEATPVEAS
jgi:hypothetical protein